MKKNHIACYIIAFSSGAWWAYSHQGTIRTVGEYVRDIPEYIVDIGEELSDLLR